jgi:hypothetical protein
MIWTHSRRFQAAEFLGSLILSCCVATGALGQSPGSRPCGWAFMRCTITPEGGLTDCSILAEYPAGRGFGKATLQVSHLFKLTPPSGGFPAGSVLQKKVGWVPPESPNQSCPIPPSIEAAAEAAGDTSKATLVRVQPVKH